MSLSEQINEDLKEAMKSGDEARKNVLRMIKSQLRNKEIELGSPLSSEDELMVLNSAVKTRKESLELYRKGGREDLVEKEVRELEIVQSYLPKALTEEELTAAVDQVIRDLDASSRSDFGRVMKEVMGRYRGRVDGRQVQELVRARLP